MNKKEGGIMDNNEKEIDEKLYRVVRKKGSHVNTKLNLDGTRSALQFTNDSNELAGPLDLLEVDEKEYIKADNIHYYQEYDSKSRTFKQIVVEEVLVPIAKENIERLLEVGIKNIKVKLDEKIIPSAKQKAKEVSEDISVFLSGVKSGIKGEKPKAIQIIESQNKKSNQVMNISNLKRVEETQKK